MKQSHIRRRPQVVPVIHVEELHPSFHAQLFKPFHAVLPPCVCQSVVCEQLPCARHPQGAVGRLPHHGDIVASRPKMLRHVVVEAITVKTAQPVDGGEPDIAMAVPDDIPYEIVGQSVFHIHFSEEIIAGRCCQRHRPRQKKCNNTIVVHGLARFQTKLIIYRHFANLCPTYLSKDYFF